MARIEIGPFAIGGRVISVSLLVTVLLVCSGCGSKADALLATTVPVQGKVTYKGKPLSQGEIMFQPVSGTMFAHGTIKKDGRFELTTFTLGDGAAVGVHHVYLSHLSEKARVPAEYLNPFSQKLEVEIIEGKEEYLVELK